MIKRLRAQFICVMMVLMAVLLCSLMVMVCYATWHSMDAEAERALQAATLEPWKPGGMSPDSPNPNYPCFILCTDSEGKLKAVGHAYYDLSDEVVLREILEEAKATGKNSGYLSGRNLKFQKIRIWKMEEYAFTDISGQICTMRSLYFYCVFGLLVGLVMCFGISWMLSRWIVRPVERAWQQQRQFVADASHELKTPLTVILANAGMLQSGEHDPQANQRMTDGIVTMGNHMRTLVEGLLELARMDNRQILLAEQVDLSKLVENSGMLFEPLYYEAGRTLEVQTQPGIFVRGSSMHLRQLVESLLENGSKYATAGTCVVMTLEQSHGKCLLRISSHGETLTSRQCRDVFKRFYRVDQVRSDHRGYGLGLAIAQSIVQAHGGKIWAEGKDGVNTFYVSLRVSRRKTK